ncbi:sulfite exporter TauE/SafE family protein [Sphingomonas sp.]|uniref:sulfite exporter TauE/SafE family protein n=1 Tax=Sphingomonas sp. TaxID=28214 RepID=UPI003F72DDEE
MIDLAAVPWSELAPFIVIGFIAQLVDGAVGMGFGVFAHTMLAALGLPPLAAANTVRSVEAFTSGVSGLCHGLQRNIDWPLFARLVVPGVIGGFLGVWVLSNLQSNTLQAIMFVYVLAIGIYLFWRGRGRPQGYRRLRLIEPIGFAGGFLDSSGVGGWGPIVTGSLLAEGAPPRTSVGTANAAEFFVTVTVLGAAFGTMGLASFTQAMTGLLLGGIVAAPLGAYVARRLPPATLTTIAAGLLGLIGVYGLLSLAIGPIPQF